MREKERERMIRELLELVMGCSVVWYGIMWYGIMWYGIVWYCIVWYCIV